MPEDDKFKNNEPIKPKVDNFSAGNEADEEKQFAMPSNDDLRNKEGTESQTFKVTSTPENEPEDIFAKKPETPPPAPTPASPPPPPTDKPASPAGGQKLDMPVEKKGHGCLWALVAVLLVVLLAVVIAINELGIANLGLEKYYGAIHLEKLWGGLPADGKEAMALSLQKMKGKSFDLNGDAQTNLSLKGQGAVTPSPSASPSPSAVLGVETNTSDSLNKIKEKGLDLNNIIKIKASVENPNKFEIDLNADLENSQDSFFNLLPADGLVDLTVIDNGDDLYLKNDSLKKIFGTDKDWLKIIMPTGESSPGGTAQIASIASSGTRIGSSKINRVSCYIYELKVNGSSLANYLESVKPNLAWIAKDAYIQSAKFYLGKRDHLMHKMEFNLNNTTTNFQVKNKIVLNFSNIGGKITVDVPSDSVLEKNWEEVKKTFLVETTAPAPSSSTVEERDQTRKSDLKKIQDALLAYKVQNGKYPSTSGVIEKTKDETSNLKTALVPKYLDSLPIDPENDKYYYGYKSDDGSKCELTSILENKNDPEGEDYNGYWIYKLKGN